MFKRIIFLSLLFSFSLVANAQLTTNVYWTTETNLPKESTLFYSKTKLKWSDFMGTVPTSNTPVLVSAITMSGFGYKANMSNTGNIGVLNIGVYCYFDKHKSWGRAERKTDYVLNHEQRHFDISYIAASIFKTKLKSTTITVTNMNSILPKLYKEVSDEMTEMQKNYDTQSRNGRDQTMQKIWDQKIDLLLMNCN